VTGKRKYNAYWGALAAFVILSAGVIWFHLPDAYITSLALGIGGVLTAFGLGNVGEHFAKKGQGNADPS